MLILSLTTAEFIVVVSVMSNIGSPYFPPVFVLFYHTNFFA